MRFARLQALALLCGLLVASASPVQAQETKLSTLRAEAKAKPTDGAAAFALGRALRRAGRYAEAKTELARAVALSKGEAAVRARYEQVVNEWEGGKPNPSLPQPPTLSMCKQVKVGKDGEALAKVCAAEAWLTFERTVLAEDELTAAEKLDGGLYEAKLARAKVDVVKADHADAITKLEALTSSSPQRAEGWYLLGVERLASGKKQEAATALRKAKDLDEGWPEVWLELSRALPDGTEARDLARQAVAMRATWPAAWIRLGELELATGGYDQAKTAFDTALKQAPKSQPAQVGLAWALVKLKKFDDAKKAAETAISLSANDANARLAMGEALAGLGEVDEAVEQFKFANGLDGKDATGLVRAVEVLLAAKQPMKAEAHAEAAVKNFPDDARVWSVRGDAALANGDKKTAKEAWKKALAAPKGTIDRAAVQKKIDAAK